MSLPILYRCANISTKRTLLPFYYRIRSLPYSTQNTKSNTHNSIRQRVKNGASFLVSSSLIVGGVGLSSIVIYLIGSELFASNGDTTLFNRAVSLCENDQTLRQWLQSNNNETFKAYGEMVTNDKWTRNRPLVSQHALDPQGNLHCKLRFHLESKAHKIALVHAEAVQYKTDNEHWYSTLKYNKPVFTMMYIDVRGKGRHFIIKPKLPVQPSKSNSSSSSNSLPFLSWLGLSK